MVKALLKLLLDQFGYRLVRNQPGFLLEWTYSSAKPLNVLDALVALELRNAEPFFFVQVGANDGRQADPLFALIHRHGLQGILVEPVPQVFRQLKSNYASSSSRDGLQFENIALTPGEGEGHMPFYVFAARDGSVPIEVSGYSSIDRARLQAIKEVSNIRQEISEVSVRFESVSHFIKNRNIPSISLLLTDVEGLDVDLTQAFLDAGATPRIINIEILGEKLERVSALANRLVTLGYTVGGNISDLIAYRPAS